MTGAGEPSNVGPSDFVAGLVSKVGVRTQCHPKLEPPAVGAKVEKASVPELATLVSPWPHVHRCGEPSIRRGFAMMKRGCRGSEIVTGRKVGS